MNDRQELIRRFAVAIAGGYQAADFRWCRVSSEDIWKVAKSLAGAEPPQPQPLADNRIERALQVLREAVTKSNDSAGFSEGSHEGWEMVDQAVQILEGQE